MVQIFNRHLIVDYFNHKEDASMSRPRLYVRMVQGRDYAFAVIKDAFTGKRSQRGLGYVTEEEKATIAAGLDVPRLWGEEDYTHEGDQAEDVTPCEKETDEDQSRSGDRPSASFRKAETRVALPRLEDILDKFSEGYKLLGGALLALRHHSPDDESFSTMVDSMLGWHNAVARRHLSLKDRGDAYACDWPFEGVPLPPGHEPREQHGNMEDEDATDGREGR